MTEHSILTAQKFASIWLHQEGQRRDGPWEFVSDGAGCMYPRFIHRDGTIVPWHAVKEARP